MRDFNVRSSPAYALSMANTRLYALFKTFKIRMAMIPGDGASRCARLAHTKLRKLVFVTVDHAKVNKVLTAFPAKVQDSIC